MMQGIIPTESFDVLPNCNLNSTVGEVKAEIRECQGFDQDSSVFLYHHLGEEIRCSESRTLRHVFGNAWNHS